MTLHLKEISIYGFARGNKHYMKEISICGFASKGCTHLRTSAFTLHAGADTSGTMRTHTRPHNQQQGGTSRQHQPHVTLVCWLAGRACLPCSRTWMSSTQLGERGKLPGIVVVFPDGQCACWGGVHAQASPPRTRLLSSTLLSSPLLLTEGCLLSAASGGTTALTLHLKEIRGGPARRQAESACMGASWLASWSSWIGQLWLLQDTRVNNPL